MDVVVFLEVVKGYWNILVSIFCKNEGAYEGFETTLFIGKADQISYLGLHIF